MQRTSKIKFIILLAPIIFILFGGFASAFTLKTGVDPQKNCNVLYQWFEIDFEQGDDVNAVGDLRQFCTAQEIILWVIERFFLFAGSIAVIFLIIGGFRYLTSAGNEEAAEKGKKTLVTSIIGLAIILLAGAIVRVVANTLGTGGASSQPSTTNQPAASGGQDSNGNGPDESGDPAPEPPAEDESGPPAETAR